MLDAHLLLELGEKMVWDFGNASERGGWLRKWNGTWMSGSGGGRQRRAASRSVRQNCRQNSLSASVMAQCYMRCPSSADEWIMVEMQGELTSHEHTSFQNLTLGTLRVQDDVRTEFCRCKISAAENQADALVPHDFCSHQGVPHLEIGNHMLEGKFENLKKPLLVCQRRPLDPSVLLCSIRQFLSPCSR
jgi:hypothetical protein